MRFLGIAAALVASTIAVLDAPPVMAATLIFSSTGSGNVCSQAAPCGFMTAIGRAFAGDILACGDNGDNLGPLSISTSVTIDCTGTTATVVNLNITGGAAVTLRNLTTYDGGNGVNLDNGTVILENVHITGFSYAIYAAPNAPSTLIVKNCLFDHNVAGVLLQPQAGGSLNATFDHVTIANNGGGMKIDATNGAVTVDITDSEISYNSASGINTVAGGGGQAIVSIGNSIIARNNLVGVQANGASAGVLISASLLDQNGAGALSVVNGGNMFTYGNNRIVGPMGSAFTSTAPLH